MFCVDFEPIISYPLASGVALICYRQLIIVIYCYYVDQAYALLQINLDQTYRMSLFVSGTKRYDFVTNEVGDKHETLKFKSQ